MVYHIQCLVDAMRLFTENLSEIWYHLDGGMKFSVKVVTPYCLV